jgi:hypothetical protein
MRQTCASDGDYAGVERALVQGVRAAKDESRRAHRLDIEIGFNVAADAPTTFWRRLGGGRTIVRASG